MPVERTHKACYQCRRKQVKCDERYPACKRCQNEGVICWGYGSKEDNELLDMSGAIVSENNSRTQRKNFTQKPRAGGRALRPLYPSSTRSTVAVETRKTADENLWALVQRSADPTSSNRLSSDWADHALCRLFSDFVIETGDVGASLNPWLGLPRWSSRFSSTTSINIPREALSAVSLVYFSNQIRSQELGTRARSHYGKTLRLLHDSIGKGMLTHDETLLGAGLLNVYEMFSGDRPPRDYVWNTHAEAMGMLLTKRGTSEQFLREDTAALCHGAHKIIMFRNLLSRKSPGPESTLFELSIQDNRTPWDEVFLACIRIARLLPIADIILQEASLDDTRIEDLSEIVRKFQEEDEQFEIWAIDNIESASSVDDQNIVWRSLRRKQASFWLGHRTWNIYRAARALLLQTLSDLALKAIEQTSVDPDVDLNVTTLMQQTQKKAWDDMHTTVKEIISTTAEALAHIDVGSHSQGLGALQAGEAVAAQISIWPLRATSSIRSLTEEQQETIRVQLHMCEGRLGFRPPTTPPS